MNEKQPDPAEREPDINVDIGARVCSIRIDRQLHVVQPHVVLPRPF